MKINRVRTQKTVVRTEADVLLMIPCGGTLCHVESMERVCIADVWYDEITLRDPHTGRRYIRQIEAQLLVDGRGD